jgi:hypothetical protein
VRKIIPILQSLELTEIRHFSDFVASPYFNKNEQVRDFCQYLVGLWPDFLDDNLQLAEIQHVLDLSDLTEKELTYLFANALELLTDFFAYEKLKHSNYQKMLLSLDALVKTNERQKLSRTVQERLKRMLDRSPSHDEDYYWASYSLHNLLDQQFLSNPSRVQDPNLQLKSEDLDIFYCYTKLKMACDMTSRNIVIQADYQCGFLEEIIDYIQKHPDFLEIKGIRIYWEILILLRKGAAEDFQRLKQTLATSIQDFEAEEMRLMYDYAQNYCIRQINSGNQCYYQEFLELYKTQLKEKVLFRNGYLEEWDYKNIVTAGVRTKEFKWTEAFIQRNKRYLREEVQENAYLYNLANYYYETQHYREALKCLHQVEFTDLSYHLGAKNIQLKSYFELNEFTAFHALIRAYKASVKRAKQLSNYRFQSYLNFLRIAQKLGDCKERISYSSNAKLQKRLAEIQKLYRELRPLANSDWVALAVEQLEAQI